MSTIKTWEDRWHEAKPFARTVGDAMQAEITELREALKVAQDEIQRLEQWHAEMADDRNALQDKLSAIEAQEPVAWIHSTDGTTNFVTLRPPSDHDSVQLSECEVTITPLYKATLVAPAQPIEELAAIEREHLGDVDKSTGIYAQPVNDRVVTPTHEMTKILERRYFKFIEHTDCASIYGESTFEQLRGLYDEGRSNNAASLAIAKVIKAVQRYLPPDGINEKDFINLVIEAVDPFPTTSHQATTQPVNELVEALEKLQRHDFELRAKSLDGFAPYVCEIIDTALANAKAAQPAHRFLSVESDHPEDRYVRSQMPDVQEGQCAHCGNFDKAAQPLTKEQVQPAQGERTPIELERWGRAENLCLRLLDRMDDGYWTPWHIATEAIESLEQRIAALLQSNAERVPLEPVNCDTCRYHYKDVDQTPCNTCIHSRDFGSNFEPRFEITKGQQ